MSRHVVLRRQFLAGLGAAASFMGLSSGPARADARTPLPPLEMELHITRRKVHVAGRSGEGYCINGQMPGPVLRWQEGRAVRLHVYNHMDEPTSLHWHGIRLPSDQDGVPGLSFAGIPPGGSFTYAFPVMQSGTYWYHSHMGHQEAAGLYGALIVEPAGPSLLPKAERDYTILLSDWSDVSAEQIVSNLKMQDDYYNFRQRSLASLPQESRTGGGLSAALKSRLQWSRMRMSATDISDVSGVLYVYLMNGESAAQGWSGLFRPGERVCLRVINAATMTLFDVRIPGLEMMVVEADGNPVKPVPVDEFRIAPGETYVVMVTPQKEQPYTIFAQSEDRTGYARGTLTPRAGLLGVVPPMDARPVRGMADMGMAMPMMKGMVMPPAIERTPADEIDDPGPPPLNVENQNVAASPSERVSSPGDGLENNGRRVLAYSDLQSIRPPPDQRPPSREIILHLTGNMERYIWGFNGRKYSESGPIRLARNERVRFTIINDTMMEHPLHLHGLWSELENGADDQHRPLKHTVISQPGSRMSVLVTADAPGIWAYHCHLMYHMQTGMFREVIIS
ncbi:multicopper oxidase domain-containing protein [Bombella sp. TMW 2.2543]|uniref:Multicopper oxidase domain-containing protein n=1 Tax=Bombella pluederhausensis TaxID=2967336 RepID=A0ABT3WI98_9PROT|nr:multicopper oxidase domain-containing protein [Bombella pluederhausensis]MCX5618393.1 multicopper oxidase domain-containing protein [Bombella pluederhausensis]